MVLAHRLTPKKSPVAETLGCAQVTPRKTNTMRAARLCFVFMVLLSQYLLISHMIRANDVKPDPVSMPGQV